MQHFCISDPNDLLGYCLLKVSGDSHINHTNSDKNCAFGFVLKQLHGTQHTTDREKRTIKTMSSCCVVTRVPSKSAVINPTTTMRTACYSELNNSILLTCLSWPLWNTNIVVVPSVSSVGAEDNSPRQSSPSSRIFLIMAEQTPHTTDNDLYRLYTLKQSSAFDC